MGGMSTQDLNIEDCTEEWWVEHKSDSRLIPEIPLKTNEDGDYLIDPESGEKRIQLTFKREYVPNGQSVSVPSVDITLSATPSVAYSGNTLVFGEKAEFPCTLIFTDNTGLCANLAFVTQLPTHKTATETVTGIINEFTNSEYPNGIDRYNIPSQPDVAYLSQNNNFPGGHAVSHQALNDSIYSIESNAFVDNSATSHDHSDPYNVDYSQSQFMSDPQSKHGRQLRIQNTHVTSDTNTTPNSEESQSADSLANTWHHTVVDPTSTVIPTQWQAVSWALWEWLGLNTLPVGYFKNQFADIMNNMKSVVANTQGDVQDLMNSLNQSTGIFNGLLQAFNNYYQNRANHFIGEYPAYAITFSPTANISEVNSGGINVNYAQVDVFSRWAILHLHPFFSAHNGVDSQVMIYQQIPQSDGSIWCPNYEIFFPMAIQEQNTQNTTESWSRDISWKPDGNIYTSSLGNAGEFDRIVNTIAKMPYNIEMLHKNSDGEIIETTNQLPFGNANA